MFFFKLIHKARVWFYYFKKRRKSARLLKRLREYANNKESLAFGDEFCKALEFYKKSGIQVFPYSFAAKYRDIKIDVFRCENYPFVKFKYQKLYLKDSWNAERVTQYVQGILCEQDPLSPHLYEEGDFCVKKNDWVLDIGSAEGNFSLSTIDRAERVYLFEYDQDWIPVLERTFESFNEKVKIIPKKVSNYDSDTTVCISNISELYEHPLFIKVDVDGNEKEVIEGLSHLLSSHSNVKLALCTYHAQDDADYYSEYMRKKGFITQFSKGYMLFHYDKNIQKPFLRRGILRSTKQSV